MPIYEYACPECGHRFEQLQRISDEPVRTCPSCGSESVRKLVSQTSFVLRGGGWYKDHYGLQTEKKSEPAKSESTKVSTDTPAKKADPKPPPSSGSAA